MDAKQWFIGGKTIAPLSPGEEFVLRNEANTHYLGYEDRDHGINLGWQEAAPKANFHFERLPSSDRGDAPIVYGERVAFK